MAETRLPERKTSAHFNAGRKPWNDGKGRGWTDARGYRWSSQALSGRPRCCSITCPMLTTRDALAVHFDVNHVHHINGVTSDNRIENLQVIEHTEHTLKHSLGAARPEQMRKSVSLFRTMQAEIQRLERCKSDLYAALEAVMPFIDEHYVSTGTGAAEAITARAALAKAKGGE